MVSRCCFFIFNRAHLLAESRKLDHITPVLISTHRLPVHTWSDFKIRLPAYKILHGSASVTPHVPAQAPAIPVWQLLDHSVNKLNISRWQSFLQQASLLWNRFPTQIREAGSVDLFQKELKTHLFFLFFYSNLQSSLVSPVESVHWFWFFWLVWLFMCACLCLHVFVHKCTYISLYMNMFVCTVHIYSMHACMYMCIHTFVNISKFYSVCKIYHITIYSILYISCTLYVFIFIYFLCCSNAKSNLLLLFLRYVSCVHPFETRFALTAYNT